MNHFIRRTTTTLRWLGLLALPMALFACSQQLASPPGSTAAFTYEILPFDATLSTNPELALAEMNLRDDIPDNDGYARLILSKGGFAGLEAFMKANALNPDAITAEFDRFGLQYTGYEPASTKESEFKPLAITDCVKYFPQSDRNRTQVLPNGRQTATIDAFGRPKSSTISWPVMIPNGRDANCQRNVGNQFTGVSLPDWDGGHLVGSALGGYGRRANLVPQNLNFNRGVWRDTENAFRTCQLLPTTFTTSVQYADNVDIVPIIFRIDAILTVLDKGKPAFAKIGVEYLNVPQGGTPPPPGLSGPVALARLQVLLRRLGCGLRLVMRPTTPYEGSTQLCPRVKGALDYEFVNVGGSFSFEFLIDDVPSPLFDLTDSGSTMSFNLTRSCNLSVGNHELKARVTDSTGTMVWTSEGAPFAVNSNQWSGYLANDTNNCSGIPGLAMDFSVSALGVAEQRQNAVQPGGAMSALINPDLTYTLQGTYTGTTIGSSTTYLLPKPFDGNPVTVNGRTGYFIPSFTYPCPDPTLLRSQTTVSKPIARIALPALTTLPISKQFSVQVP